LLDARSFPFTAKDVPACWSWTQTSSIRASDAVPKSIASIFPGPAGLMG
jgi:hypothetical protein